MARSTLLAALVATVVLAGASSSTARQSAPKSLPGSPVFVISGRGWGHGVGMAQWGAYGYAQQGYSYDEILAHYYKGTTHRAGVRHEGARVPRAGTVAADGLVPVAVQRARRDRPALAPRRGPADLRAGAEDQDERLPPAPAAARTAHVQRRLVAAQVRRPSVPRPGAGLRRERSAARGQRRRARGVPLRRRPVGDAARLGAGGAQGAGGRRALLRARGEEERVVVRPLPGYAEPGLSRHRPRGAVDDRGGAGHRGSGRPLRRDAWRRRTSSRAREAAPRLRPRSGRAHRRRSVSRVRQRPVRHDLAVSPVGPVRRSRVAAEARSPRARAADRRDDADRPVRPRPERDRDRLAGRLDDDRLGSSARAEPSLDVVPDRRALARHSAGARHVRQERRAERRRAAAARRCGSTGGSRGLPGSRSARSRRARVAR